MKVFKLILIFSTLTFFFIACSQTNSNTITVNQNGTTASYEAVPTGSRANANQTAASTDEFAAARKIYAESCVGCHKENGAGGEGLFEGKKVKVPGYKSKGAMSASDEKLADYITNGEQDEMPAFKGKLTSEEIQGLVKFIRREFQGK